VILGEFSVGYLSSVVVSANRDYDDILDDRRLPSHSAPDAGHRVLDRSRSLKSIYIYTENLIRKGIRLKRGRDIDVMQAVTVSEVMSHDHTPVMTTLPLHELGLRFAETHLCDGQLSIMSVANKQ